ncbi:tRNA (adenosine(37)-N6)-threonylcarbamoyltransferase complex ATPase subunit type 1 TsaE [Pseudoxanthomonas sp. GM95]|uniref:tRNA (adenosine(37)-N6)-threonylcarbamoyltransferase complex ATPase subunit type 1 TsaE n=1 Tax=Pseudoxanthomonas sp. GM95 TaxID=1881043 RepID=UPI000B8A4EF0|nr:tRNA (adenosine(37)-N6)-threonylcarbamoyltransferase complex ATPase subunit type 1 TsaE [Pseudoxanthomonas sp. GM95]
MMDLHLATAEDTAQLGVALAQTRPPLAAVHLHGDLGAGKSTLARALLRGLGVTGAVRSPTYTLVERYAVEGGEAWHLDLYRLGDAGELDFLGLDEAVATLWLIEWPEKGRGGLPPPDLEIHLAIDGDGRSARLVAGSDAGRGWLAQAAKKTS